MDADDLKRVVEDLAGTASLAATMMEGIGRVGFNDSKAARKGLMATAEELRVAAWKAMDLLHPDDTAWRAAAESHARKNQGEQT